jgi:hypothetical protein
VTEQTLIPTSSTSQLWSVTTLIKQGLGTGEGIVRWAVETTASAAIDNERAWKSRLELEGRDSAIKYLESARFESSNKAKDRGTDIHRAAEALALGESFEIDPALMPYVERFREWLDLHCPRFLMAEAPVYNTTWGYAGTCDGLLELPSMPGVTFIYDMKTTEHGPDAVTRGGNPKNRPPFPEVALQLCAYARAEVVGVLAERRYAQGKRYYVFDPTQRHEPMPHVDHALCIVVSPHDCFAVPVRIDDGVWQTWTAVLKTARWTQMGDRDLFGPPIEGPGPSVLERQLEATLEAIA